MNQHELTSRERSGFVVGAEESDSGVVEVTARPLRHGAQRQFGAVDFVELEVAKVRLG